MTAVMSYQYPPLPPGPEEVDQHSNLMSAYHLPAIGAPSHQQPHQFDRLNSPDERSQGGNGSKKDQMRRSLSTPNVRKQAQAESLLSAEKRRNKLGYHRTSVACGHCRRRKIRCIPAPGDPQSRCSNCIRLKKECNFFPVDQQPPAGDPSIRDPKAKPFQRDSASPPAPGHPTDLQGGIPYHHLQMPPLHDLGGPSKKARTDSFSNDGKAPSYPRPGEFAHPNASWAASDTASVTAKTPSDMAAPYGWRMSNESPMTPAFSPYSVNTHLPSHSQWPTSATTEPSPRDPNEWSIPPQRSMSYGSLESIPQNAPYTSYPPPPNPPPTSRAGMMQPGEGYGSVPAPSSSAPAAENAMVGTPTNVMSHPSGPTHPPPPPFPVQSQNWPSYTFDKAPLPSTSQSYSPAQWYPSQGPTLPSQAPTQPPMQQQPYSQEQPQYGGMYYPPPPHGR